MFVPVPMRLANSLESLYANVFILPLWLFCFVLAFALLFFKKYRFLAPHVVLCSTGALVGCFLFSALFLLGVTKFDRPNPSAFLATAFLVGLVVVSIIGACVGFVSGFFIARWFNRQVGWTNSQETSR